MKRKHRGHGDTCYIDEVFVRINVKKHYLWRALDQDDEVVDVFIQNQRAAAKRFFKRLLRSCGDEPRKIVTDKLRSYRPAHREDVSRPRILYVARGDVRPMRIAGRDSQVVRNWGRRQLT